MHQHRREPRRLLLQRTHGHQRWWRDARAAGQTIEDLEPSPVLIRCLFRVVAPPPAGLGTGRNKESEDWISADRPGAGRRMRRQRPPGAVPTGPIVFTAQLSAANEVPAITNAESNGRGNTTITFTCRRQRGAVTAGHVTFACSDRFPAARLRSRQHTIRRRRVNGGVLLGTTLSATARSSGGRHRHVTVPATRDITQAEPSRSSPIRPVLSTCNAAESGGRGAGAMTRTQ